MISTMTSEASTYDIVGIHRTKEFVIRTEIELCSCDDPDTLQQQLLKTGLFYSVDIQEISAGYYKILIEEKWTTIPIFKLNSGGGTTQVTLGVYDPHLFGYRVETGFQYERLGDAPSFVFWNKIPRVRETRFFTDLQYWKTKRIRLKYNPDVDQPTLIKALLLDSERLYAGFGYELNSDFKFQTLIESQKDVFSTELIPVETLAKVPGQIIPPESKVSFYGLQFDYGSLRQELGLQIGTLVSGQLKLGVPSRGENFSNLKIELNHYSLVYQDWLFAQRLRIGTTDTNILQHWNYLGGLESIRGFVDNRFATKNYWLSNSELRKFFIEKPSWILQAVTFADLLGIDESSKRIEDVTAASAGFGLRLIMPKIYRLVVRVDYAKPFINKDSENVSFGIQQFF
jgi:hypothetical protein